jgi:hypothetical protein
VQGGGRRRETSVMVDGVEKLQGVERDLHVKNIERIIQNVSL